MATHWMVRWAALLVLFGGAMGCADFPEDGGAVEDAAVDDAAVDAEPDHLGCDRHGSRA
ncbi:MAG: hypothetical protein ACI9WU_001326 [Myxococcota bacterium]|jgi:hypothetical protein